MNVKKQRELLKLSKQNLLNKLSKVEFILNLI